MKQLMLILSAMLLLCLACKKETNKPKPTIASVAPDNIDSSAYTTRLVEMYRVIKLTGKDAGKEARISYRFIYDKRSGLLERYVCTDGTAKPTVYTNPIQEWTFLRDTSGRVAYDIYKSGNSINKRYYYYDQEGKLEMTKIQSQSRTISTYYKRVAGKVANVYDFYFTYDDKGNVIKELEDQISKDGLGYTEINMQDVVYDDKPTPFSMIPGLPEVVLGNLSSRYGEILSVNNRVQYRAGVKNYLHTVNVQLTYNTAGHVIYDSYEGYHYVYEKAK
jgi:hypothetical protein